MAKFNEEYFRQKIGWYKQLFTLFFAVEVACIVWFVANFDKFYKQFIILDVLAVLIIAGALGVFIHKIRKYIKLLKD